MTQDEISSLEWARRAQDQMTEAHHSINVIADRTTDRDRGRALSLVRTKLDEARLWLHEAMSSH